MHLNNVIDSVDCFLISGFNFESEVRSCFISYNSPFQGKKKKWKSEILFAQEK